jgi:putative peptidoglycan lipid II flippase
MVGLIDLKTPIVNLLFQRGMFDYGATEMTARALLFYCVGLWAIAGARTVVPAFYSLQDTRTPLRIGLICLGANVAFIAVLIHPLKHGGLALATSLSSTLNLVLLFWKLNSKLGKIDITKNVKTLLKNIFCSLPMGLAAYLICSLRDWTTTGNTLEKAILLLTGIVVGLGVYLLCSYWIKNEEMMFLMKMVKRKSRQ